MKKIIIYVIIGIVIITLIYLIWHKKTGKSLMWLRHRMETTDLIFRHLIIQNKEEFLKKVINVSDTLGLKNPNHLMAVMYKESGFNPKARNGDTLATGLIQFMPATASALNTNVNALYNMSNVEQLDYVLKYYQLIKKWTHKNLYTYEDLYLATFFPAALGKPDDYILKTSKLSAGIIAAQNPGIDLDKNHIITVGEFKMYTRKHLGEDIVSRL